MYRQTEAQRRMELTQDLFREISKTTDPEYRQRLSDYLDRLQQSWRSGDQREIEEYQHE